MNNLEDDLYYIYEKVLDAVMTWPKNTSVPTTTRPLRRNRRASSSDQGPSLDSWGIQLRLPGHHTLEEEIGHAFHLASISILAVLVAGVSRFYSLYLFIGHYKAFNDCLKSLG